MLQVMVVEPSIQRVCKKPLIESDLIASLPVAGKRNLFFKATSEAVLRQYGQRVFCFAVNQTI